MLTSLGELALVRGHHDEALSYCTSARRLAAAASDTYEEARALRVLGQVQADGGDGVAAQESWRSVHALFDRLRLPEADAVAVLIAGATAATGATSAATGGSS